MILVARIKTFDSRVKGHVARVKVLVSRGKGFDSRVKTLTPSVKAIEPRTRPSSLYDPAMTAITLRNILSPATSPSAELRVSRGDHQIARIIVYAGGTASIPTAGTLTAQAFTNMGEFELTSNTLEVSGPPAAVRAQVIEKEGFSDFTITHLKDVHSDGITLLNGYTEPVTFTLTLPNSSFQLVTGVDANAEQNISTVQQWTVYAIVNGITTPAVTFTRPDATIVLKRNNDEEGFVLDVVPGAATR